MARGYMGKILWVNLSTKELKDEVLDENLCRHYVGGYGLGAKIIFDRMPAGTDPLGPDAIFGLVTGPFDGTQALGGSRYVAVGKSPLTGGWGDANSGGNFGPQLKYAGYDGGLLYRHLRQARLPLDRQRQSRASRRRRCLGKGHLRHRRHPPGGARQGRGNRLHRALG